MRNTFNLVDIIYLVLTANATIMGAINGKVYKNQRPLNSDKQDIVVGSLPINAEQIQQTVMNVNVHIPNLKISINGAQDNTQPDLVKLEAVTAMVIEGLKDKVFGDYWFDIQQQNLFADEATNEHYSNIRINFYSENI